MDGLLHRCIQIIDVSYMLLIDVPVVDQARPNLVLTNANAEQTFLTALQSTLSDLQTGTSNTTTSSLSSSSATATSMMCDSSVQLEFRPQRDFASSSGKEALSKLKIVEEGVYSRQIDNLREQDYEADGDAYLFGRNGMMQGEDQDERGRRNNELRLGSFLDGLDSSCLSVSLPSICYLFSLITIEH